MSLNCSGTGEGIYTTLMDTLKVYKISLDNILGGVLLRHN